MRIQHNIMAMNAFRNYNTNTNALGRNLEKLSSGYKINRAGDDAAGLAISEKMRAQISGLKQAQANVKDGISLVKTAEGALQEVQDMLNRMTTLATQSANGTYDDKVDRDNLQKEVKALAKEIDRIADSSNFNGTKLLDGSMGSVANISTVTNGADAVGGTAYSNSTTTLPKGDTDMDAGDEIKIAYKNAAGTSKTLTLTVGTDISVVDAKAGDADKLLAAITGKNDADFNATFNVAVVSSQLKFTAKEKDADIAVTSITVDQTKGVTTGAGSPTAGALGSATPGANPTTPAKGASFTIDFGDKTGKDVIGSSVTIEGNVYEFVANAADKSSDDAIAVVISEGDDATEIATALAGMTTTTITNADTTKSFTVADDLAGTLTITSNETGTSAKAASVSQLGAGLTLQIGDTAENYNQLKVKVGDMHTKALGVDIGSISVATQEDAAKAIEAIKTAINTVSSTRGDLGANQNRLEHTTNNLAIMTENIQDAESTIRDVDIADEMTAYTKNNILLQSAQAMLAQANQMPQGVLQLLQ